MNDIVCTLMKIKEIYLIDKSIRINDSCKYKVKVKSDKMSKKKTHEEYVAEVSIKHPNIEVVGQYVRADVEIQHHCLIHNHYWYAKPGNIVHGSGCRFCGIESSRNKKTKTIDQIKEELAQKAPQFEVAGEYNGAREKMWFRCIKHDQLWETWPGNAINGHGCPMCHTEQIVEKLKKTHDEYLRDLLSKGIAIVPIELYDGADVPIKHKCLKCGNEWNSRPGNILFGNGCPRCGESHGETEIEEWLKSNHINYEREKRFNDCIDKRPLPFDFYLTDKNILIEYDGEQHYKSIDYFGGDEMLSYRQKHDAIKDNYCKEKGIKLLRIPYNKNIQEELNNFILT